MIEGSALELLVRTIVSTLAALLVGCSGSQHSARDNAHYFVSCLNVSISCDIEVGYWAIPANVA
jgi:hypothetical protein